MPNCWSLILILFSYSVHAASVTLAWDASDSSDVTNYVVKYGTSPGIYTASESAGKVLTRTISGLPDGFRYYFVVICQSPLGESEFSNQVSYRQPTTNRPVYLIFQSEHAALQSSMEIKLDQTAIGDAYVVSTNDESGTMSFTPNSPFVDEFVIWTRIMSVDGAHDSFYVGHNNDSEDVYDTVRVFTNVWQWTTVNGRGGVNAPFEDAFKIDPRIFLLTGSDKIIFRGRERETPIDAIIITNDRGLRPAIPSTPQNLQLTLESR